jgi:hypothetical protein
MQVWKIVDEQKLAGRIKRALRGLEEGERRLVDEDPGSPLQVELRAQQLRLR